MTTEILAHNDSNPPLGLGSSEVLGSIWWRTDHADKT